ncbi:RNA-directed DNA polymerase [Kribbella soli]
MELDATDLFDRTTSSDNLADIYYRKISTSLARGRDGLDGYAVGESINSLCERLSISLRSGSHTFTQYRENLISKGAGKPPRSISIPTVRDRIALRALAEYLVELYPWAKGTIPQHCIASVQSSLDRANHDSFVRLDVRDFFPTINHSLISDRLLNDGVDPRAADLIERAIQTPTVADGAPRLGAAHFPTKGVPQGLAISNVLAELAVSPVDIAMRSAGEATYIRFVDDILILCDTLDVNRLSEYCKKNLSDLGLVVHPEDSQGKSATGPIAGGFDYLGYVFSKDSTSVRDSSVRRMESRLARSFTEYRRQVRRRPASEQANQLKRCEWFLNLAITGCIYRGAARGWLQYFRQMDDQRLLKSLDLTIQRFQSRFGMPDNFRPKKFMSAYWPIKHPRPDGRYIPNFDNYSVPQMREHLRTLTPLQVDELNEFQIMIAFRRNIDKAVSDLERDIGFVS